MQEIAARAAELSRELGRTVSPSFEVFIAQVRDGQKEQRQWTCIRKDGSRVPAVLQVSAMCDAAGTVTGYLMTMQFLNESLPPQDELAQFFDLSRDMFGIASTDGFFKRVNPSFNRTLGWTDKEILSRPFLDFVHPADQAATLREVEKLAVGEPTLHFENRYRCKDGSWRRVAWTCTPQPDGALYAAGRDVTELKQAEEDLRQTKQDLAITLDSIGDAVLATDAARRITRMNSVAEQLTGWTQSEAVGRPIEDVFRIINEETRDPALIPVDDVLATGIVHGLANHTVLIARDGTERPIADSAAPIRDDAGQITGVVLVFRDVATERQFERELQQLNADLERRVEERTKERTESERRHRTLLANLPGMAYRCHHDADWTMEFVSEGCRELLGIEPNDLARGIYQFASLISPDDLASVAARCESGLQARSPIVQEYRIILPDGRTKWVWEQARGIYREDGTVEAIEGFIKDITDRKHSESKIQESERFNRATLDSLSAHVAVLDASGKIVATNRAWRRFAGANDTAWQTVGEGTNYLAICDRAAEAGDSDARAAARAIRQVLAGEQESWVHEYPCHSADEQRWFYCRVTRFPDDGAAHVVVSHENITAMKLAQERLATIHSRFETLHRFSPVAILFFDSHGNCVDANDRWCEMSGNPREAALGEKWASVVHPEDRTRVTREWREAVQNGTRFQSEYRALRPNGESVWLVSQGLPIRDKEGGVSGFICVSTDITERKQTEEALRLLSTDLALLSGATFYKAVVTQLAELLDCEMAFISARDPARPKQLSTLAFTLDGTIQANFSYPFAGTPCEQVVDRRSCIIASGASLKYPGDVFLTDYQIESYIGVPFIDSQDRQIGHMGVMSRYPLTHPEQVEAVTKLFAVSVVAEMERQVSERRFSDLFEFSPDAIVITDRDGLIVQANRQVAAVFGWTPAELVGQPVEVLMPVNLRVGHPQLRERYLQSALPRAMGSGRSDLLGLRKDGSAFPVDISLSPMQTPEGLLVAAAVRDVTERQHILKELRTAHDVVERERAQLAIRVAERTEELERANQKLVQASQAKSEFLSTMSHELRTPLNGILGMNELLLTTELNDRQRQYVEACNSSGKILVQLINDILDLSKIEAGKLELDPRECDLESLVYDTAEIMSHTVEAKGLTLQCRLSPDASVVGLCDDNRLRQILINLVGNAIKFTSSGSVTLA